MDIMTNEQPNFKISFIKLKKIDLHLTVRYRDIPRMAECGIKPKSVVLSVSVSLSLNLCVCVCVCVCVRNHYE